MTDLTLKLDTVTLVRGGRTLIAGLSFEAGRGEIIQLEGPNGIGKSSLLRAVAGFLTPDQGAITLREADREVDRQDHLALLEELPALKPSETVFQMLCFARRMAALGESQTSIEDRAEAAAEAMAITALLDSENRLLSTGQRRRAALARLSLSARSIWLMDEPQNGLDTFSRDLLARMMTRHIEQGGIILLASHDPLNLGPMRSIDLGAHLPALDDSVAELAV